MTQLATPQPAVIEPNPGTIPRPNPQRRRIASVGSGSASVGCLSPYDHLKRALDIAFILAAAPFWLPLLGLLCLLVRLDSPGPAIYRQPRLGFNGRTFTILKIRTMIPDADRALAQHLAACDASLAQWHAAVKLKDDPRHTRLGRILRRFSLDELPQLINVLRGDMALIGPRPIPDAEVPRYGRSFAHYTTTRPGLTGLWQVSGRNELPYPTRVALDHLYLRTRSFPRDALILLKTPHAILSRRGAY